MLTPNRCLFHPLITAEARKRPRSLCQRCRWQVTPKYACTLDPTKSEWADYAAVQAECRNLSGNELTRNLPGNIRSQSSQLAEPLGSDPGIKSKISVCELASEKKATTTTITNAPTEICRPVVSAGEDGIRDMVMSRGLGDVYKRQVQA